MKKIIILFLTAMICISIHGQANDKYRLKYNNPNSRFRSGIMGNADSD